MRKAGILGNLNGIVFSVALLVIFSLEVFGQVIEQGVGYYLKWENHNRPQLGRIWERDREKIVAQKKIETILSSLSTQEQSSESIKSFQELFANLNPAVPQMVSRKKFLQLYFEFPEQLSTKNVSPYELLEIDSNRDWQRVLLTQEGDWVYIETNKGRIGQRLAFNPDLDPRIVMASFGWWFPEEPSSLHGWNKSNINILTRSEPPYDPTNGAVDLRGIPCRVYKS